MKESGIVSHVDMEGEITRVGNPFSNGMMYPGDFGSGADLGELINCRCTIMPFVMPEGYMAPAGQPYFREEDLVKMDKVVDKPENTVGHGGNLMSDESMQKYVEELYEKKGYSISKTKAAEIQQSIDRYSTTYYNNVRKYNELGEEKFRKWIEENFGEYDKDYWDILVNNTKKTVESIDDFLEKTPSYLQETVYKGLRILPTDGEMIFKVGETFTEKSFASFSSEKNQAKRFGSTILQTINKKGKSIKSLSAHPDEKEIVMPKNIKYKITDVIMEGSGHDANLRVSLEEI